MLEIAARSKSRHTISVSLIDYKLKMESFRKLGLSEQLLKLLERAGIKQPSEIQEKVIPLVLQGKDVIGGSATGSGKTLAFGTGIIEKLSVGKGLQTLILTPTRELAEQVGNVFERFSEYKNLRVAIVYGGVSITHQIKDIRVADIVVGTPGRIIDHMERGTINFSDLKVLVLDEADRMLDMGFINDVEKIIRNCPKERQTLLFSATISGDIEHIANKHMKKPEIVSVESYVDPLKLKQIYYDTPRNLKFSLLVHLLKREEHGLVMVFCNTRHNTDFIERNLRNLGVDVLAIHVGLTQQKRNKIMEKFSGSSKVHVLVCTDIAARGLDIKGVSHVYNYDIPKTSKDYIHRIGRTARAGKEGIAINILSDRDYENFSSVLKDDSIKVDKEEMPKVEMVRMMMQNQGMQRRERWDSNDWRGRQANRESHSSRRESSIRDRPREESYGGGGRSHGISAGRSFGGGGGPKRDGGRGFGGGPRRSFGGNRPGGSSGMSRRGHSGGRSSGSRFGRDRGGSRGGSRSGGDRGRSFGSKRRY